MFWRLVQLVLVLIAASLLGALGYRAIVRRLESFAAALIC